MSLCVNCCPLTKEAALTGWEQHLSMGINISTQKEVSEHALLSKTFVVGSP